MTCSMAVFTNFGVSWKNWSDWILTCRGILQFILHFKNPGKLPIPLLLVEYLLRAGTISRLIVMFTKSLSSGSLCSSQGKLTLPCEQIRIADSKKCHEESGTG